jgi:peptidoglycan/xylan/chitin deacetylase (PgdA/CDA1 family)
MLKKLHIISDRRQPFFIPYHIVNSFFLKRKIKIVNAPNQIYILITYDVENFWGTEKKANQDKNKEFLKENLNIKKSNCTYFIPGNLISVLADHLKTIANENEIGLHGHHHELWREAHFVTKKPIKNNEKEKLLLESLAEFEKKGFNRPISFRAPYMWCKASDMKILQKLGFKVDSSDSSQYGVYFSRNSGPIMRIPVSTNPFPHYNKKRGMFYTKFRLLNLKLLNNSNQDEFYQCADQILRLQVFQKQIPHLVFLLHSWEFYKDDEKGWGNQFNHRGEKNYEILLNKLKLLEKKYSVKYVTLNEFRNIFEK